MATARMLASPPPMPGAGGMSLNWGRGACDLRLSSFVRRPPTLAALGDRRGRPRPSLRLHRELHIHRFLPDGRPWTYEVVDLPDLVRDAGRLVSPPRAARAAFTDMVHAMEYGGLPGVALEHMTETLLGYVREVAGWALRPGAPPFSTQVCAAVHVSMILQEEEGQMVQGYYGEQLLSLPTATPLMEATGMMDNQLAGGIRESCAGCGEEEEGEECCAICFERMARRERRWLPCSHSFHGECVGRWLLEKAECPLCRREVTGTA